MNKENIKRLKHVHYGMMQRCYNSKVKGYDNYGGNGVTVCEKWHSFEGFLEDVPLIKGWDAERYVLDKLALDKDSIIWGNKLYSVATCQFLTPEDNNKIKPNQQFKLIGMSPNGDIHKFTSANGFAKKHSLNYNNILRCARGEQEHTKNWQFRVEDGLIDNPFKAPMSWYKYLIGLSPEGVLYRFYNASEFSREHNLLEASVIYACAKFRDTHTRGWQFRYEEDLKMHPFLPISGLNKSKKDLYGGREFIATNPERISCTVSEITKFAKDNSLNIGCIRKCLRGEQKTSKGWSFYWKY